MTSASSGVWGAPSWVQSPKNDDCAAGDGGVNEASERSLGRIPVLLVRMISDTPAGEAIKSTGAGNRYTVLEETGITISTESDQAAVEA